MKTKILTSLLLVFLLCAGSGAQVALADSSQATIYVVPAISDDKILPTSSISSGYISNEISVAACAGEYEAASFVVRALDNITGLEVTATDLSSGGAVIPSGNVDIRVVKCWYQAGTGQDVWNDITGKFFTPELLLKDDALVKVENEENYVRSSTTGEYIWISERAPVSEYSVPFSELPIQDSAVLQPVDIAAGTNKQFWVTFEVPEGQAAGVYTGSIDLRVGAQLIAELQVQLEVLPFTLAQSYMINSLYYLGTINGASPGISSYNKTETQFMAEQINMLAHGATSPQLSRQINDTLFTSALTIRQQLGMSGRPIFLSGTPWSSITGSSKVPPQTQSELDQLRTIITHYVSLCQNYGFTDVYFYAMDEPTVSELTAELPALQAIYEAGGKVYSSNRWNVDSFPIAGEWIDLVNWAGGYGDPAPWHSINHKIVSYAKPQVGVEKPETYRRNFGLLLWQIDYDGSMDFAYQFSELTNPWNDFDTRGETRDHNFTYPTMDGVVDTIQWEGWREGVDDVRYLTTLLQAIEVGIAQGMDVSVAEAWLASLKSSDLTTQNLDTVRSEMVDHILSLQGGPSNQPPVLNAIGDKSVDEGQLLEFTVLATDADGDTLTYSASNLPDGASFDPSTRTFSWTPTVDGIYSGIHFEVSDGELSDAEDITITVNNVVQSDVNSDGAVNVLDLVLVGQRWDEVGPNGWISEDINEDGTVNVLDIILVGQYWTG